AGRYLAVRGETAGHQWGCKWPPMGSFPRPPSREEGVDEDGGLVHVLTLIAPCSCGTYLTVELADEDHLIGLLDDLDTEPGAPVACDYRLRIRASSYADPAHSSVEPPL
ncbi:hypothetical protein, partial [Streptomyces sp. NPDC002758]